MLTLFTIPKPFRGHIDVIQRNAIGSWTRLGPACEVLLFGDESGMAEVARELQVRHVPQVARNEFGTPLLDDVFHQAQEKARHNLLCYVNADVLLMGDFARAVERMARCPRMFLASGQRWDFDLQQVLTFEAGWEERLAAEVARTGKLQTNWAIDYFLSRRDFWVGIPPFAVGRAAWDNWLFYHARARGAWLIDLTEQVQAVHQNHDYAHHPAGTEGVFKGPEAQRNRELAGGEEHLFYFNDATHRLTAQGLRRALDRPHFRRYLKSLGKFHPRLNLLARITDRYLRGPARGLWKALDAISYPRI